MNINEVEAFLGIEQTERHDGFICVLTGQFSSGKSKFMNRMFGEEYLPVGTSETTAVPTYIAKGDNEAFVVQGNSRELINISEINKYRKKGFSDCERIELSLDCPNIPVDVTFIDTPGINSLTSEKSEDELCKADAVLYFMGKCISAVDVKEIDDICRKKDVKLILVRTRIDDIKASEENICETHKEEWELIERIYPAANFYFVSLFDDKCKENEISQLMAYIKYDIVKELRERSVNAREKYISNTLIPALRKMETEICSKDAEVAADGRLRETNRQLKAISKNFKRREAEICRQIEYAKVNYTKNGYAFIQKHIEQKGNVSDKEIQAYILDCIRCLEEWYALEFEDVVANVCSNAETEKNQKLISEELVSAVFSKYAEMRKRFTDYTVLGRNELFEDVQSAQRKLKSILEAIFNKIDANFDDVYSTRIDRIIDQLKEQYDKENKLIKLYASSNEAANLRKIKEYLSELDGNGTRETV